VAQKVGNTPLLLAANRGHAKVVLLLLEAGANTEAVTSVGNTPLLAAVLNGHARIASTLLSAGADVNRANNSTGVTPLIAAASGEEALVTLLLEAKAEIHARDASGKRAIEWARQLGSRQVVDMLGGEEHPGLVGDGEGPGLVVGTEEEQSAGAGMEASTDDADTRGGEGGGEGGGESGGEGGDGSEGGEPPLDAHLARAIEGLRLGTSATAEALRRARAWCSVEGVRSVEELRTRRSEEAFGGALGLRPKTQKLLLTRLSERVSTSGGSAVLVSAHLRRQWSTKI
jgi:hypothetical protein